MLYWCICIAGTQTNPFRWVFGTTAIFLLYTLSCASFCRSRQLDLAARLGMSGRNWRIYSHRLPTNVPRLLRRSSSLLAHAKWLHGTCSRITVQAHCDFLMAENGDIVNIKYYSRACCRQALCAVKYNYSSNFSMRKQACACLCEFSFIFQCVCVFVF